MKRIFLFILFLGVGIIFFFSSTTAQELASGQDEKIEALFDETMKDVGKLVAEPSPSTQKETKDPGVASVPEEKKSQELIDLEFNQADLENVLKVIAEVGGINIVLDPAIKGRKIDLHLKKITVTEALEILYSAHGLGSYHIGNILFISSEDKIKKGTTKTKIVKLRNINVDETKTLLGNLVNVITLSKEINTLILVGAAQDLDKAMAILEKLDVPQPQVLLEAKVIEINDDYLRQLGLDWPDSITTTVQETQNAYQLGSATVTDGEEPLRIQKLVREALQFDVTLQMLEQKNKAKVLSSPRVTTINNKEAQIFIGDKIPYTITTVTGGAAATEVRFVEPGIRLRITPSIIEEDFVVIKIEPEVSYIYSWRGTGDQYPWVKSREATAYVRVKNGQPFIMGGLLSKEDKNNLYQVPFLGKIPLLGNLFTYEKKIDYNTDLIITVTPTIMLEGA